MPNEANTSAIAHECTLNWDKLYRLIPSHFPPIDLFENVANSDDLEIIFALESLTNDRLLEQAGNLALVPPNERVSVAGSSAIMAAFTHIGLPSRFTDGRWYGVYYGGDSLQTAIAETKYHREQFFAATNEPDTEITMRCYVNQVALPLHDIRGPKYEDCHQHDYDKPQKFAALMRKQGSNGLVYRSVRHAGGQCVAAFKPKAVTLAVQAGHYRYAYNGSKQQIEHVLAVSLIEGCN